MDTITENFETSMLMEYLNIIPTIMLVVDADMRIYTLNQTTSEAFDISSDAVFYQRGGDALRCINSLGKNSGCGSTKACNKCVIRNSINEALKRDTSIRQFVSFIVNDKAKRKTFDFMLTAAPVSYQGERRALIVLEDVSEIVSLRKLIPICSSCKKVRNDSNYWESVDSYLAARTNLDFTHSICPDCVKVLYPEFTEQ